MSPIVMRFYTATIKHFLLWTKKKQFFTLCYHKKQAKGEKSDILNQP